MIAVLSLAGTELFFEDWHGLAARQVQLPAGGLKMSVGQLFNKDLD